MDQTSVTGIASLLPTDMKCADGRRLSGNQMQFEHDVTERAAVLKDVFV